MVSLAHGARQRRCSGKSQQVHVALLALAESENFDIVLGAAPSGLEALRRLVPCWDPLSVRNAEHFFDKSWFEIGSNCKIFLQDSRRWRNWFADTKGGNRAEQQQPLLMSCT